MENLKFLQLPLIMVNADVWSAIHCMNLETVFLTRGATPLNESKLRFMEQGPNFMTLTLSEIEAEALLLSQSSSYSISRFHITIDPVSIRCNLDRILRNLPVALPNLRSLSITLQGSRPTFSSSMFGPLGAMVLTTLDIQIPTLESFPDLGFQPILRSLPGIMHLKLLPSSPSAPRATLRTLGLIALHCSNIRSVAIRLDCAKSALPDRMSFPRTFGMSLEQLNMEFSPVEDEMAVAVALIHLFPQRIPDIQSSPVSFGHVPLGYRPTQSSTEFTTNWRGVYSALQTLYQIIQTSRAQDLERLAKLEAQLDTQDRLLFEAHSRMMELEGGLENTDSLRVDG
ncbi:hypothetical protein DL93DRAFT_1783483 [Clavulina sp. PMI_390]|nr:hypothetical protein DL93DRAFT_1783483 [Clavulina sp. PMI_390]